MKHLSTAIGGAFLLACAVSNPSHAITTYTYAGNNYDQVVDATPPAGSYDASMSVSGFFSVLVPLPPNLIAASFPLEDFSFFDGRNSYMMSNSIFWEVTFTTDSSGNITAWRILAETGSTADIGQRVITQNDLAQVIDRGFMFDYSTFGLFLEDVGEISGSPGHWTSSAQVPVPAALPLFATGLAGLGWLAQRRRKQSA